MVGMNGSDDDGETLGVICLFGMNMMGMFNVSCGGRSGDNNLWGHGE